MRILPLLLLSSTLALATEFKPFVTATTGLTLPYVEFEEENSLVPTLGYSFTLGGGARVPLVEKLDAEASAGLTFVSGGLDGEESDSYSSRGVNRRAVNTMEATAYPRLLDLDAGLSYQLLSRFSVEGGFTFSVPVGGTWEVENSHEVTCTPTGTSYCSEENESDKNSGDIDEIEDESELETGSFASLRLGGGYAIGHRLSLTSAILFPLSSWVDEQGVDVSWARVLIGGRYSF